MYISLGVCVSVILNSCVKIKPEMNVNESTPWFTVKKQTLLADRLSTVSLNVISTSHVLETTGIQS